MEESIRDSADQSGRQNARMKYEKKSGTDFGAKDTRKQGGSKQANSTRKGEIHEETMNGCTEKDKGWSSLVATTFRTLPGNGAEIPGQLTIVVLVVCIEMNCINAKCKFVGKDAQAYFGYTGVETEPLGYRDNLYSTKSRNIQLED